MRTHDMGPSWPDRPVFMPLNPGGCPPGSWPAADRYGPMCVGIGIGDIVYPEANAQLQPGPTRWGPPEVWCPPGSCPEGFAETHGMPCPVGRQPNAPIHAAAKSAFTAASGLVGNAILGPVGAIAGAAGGRFLAEHLSRRRKNPGTSFAARVGLAARASRLSAGASPRGGYSCRRDCRRLYPKSRVARVRCYNDCAEW